MLIAIDRDELKTWDVLEIGCGSGRIAELLSPMVNSYTDFDIAPGMVEAAKNRCRTHTNTRFLVGDGLSLPSATTDRRHQCVLTIAVLIHLPKSVIRSNLESAWQYIAPGGQLRLQVLADPSDPTGIETPEQNIIVAEDVQIVLDQRTREEIDLSNEEHYMGHAFRYDETREFLGEVTGGAKISLYRGHLGAIYGLCDKPL